MEGEAEGDIDMVISNLKKPSIPLSINRDSKFRNCGNTSGIRYSNTFEVAKQAEENYYIYCSTLNVMKPETLRFIGKRTLLYFSRPAWYSMYRTVPTGTGKLTGTLLFSPIFATKYS
jgi:hypothetical protein